MQVLLPASQSHAGPILHSSQAGPAVADYPYADASNLLSAFSTLLHSPAAAKMTALPPATAAAADYFSAGSPASSSAASSGCSTPSLLGSVRTPDSFDRALDALQRTPVFDLAKSAALLPVLNTTPATPVTSPSRVSFTLSPDAHLAEDELARRFDDGETLDRSTSVRAPLASPFQAAGSTFHTLRKRCKSLPALPPETDVDPTELVRQLSEAALDDTFGSALRLNAHRMTLKIEQRYMALLELVETERDYVADLHVFSAVYLDNLEALACLSEDERALVRRNVEALQNLHQFLSSSFESIEADVRWQGKHATGSVADDARVLDALARIAEVFLKVASDFSVYEYFCSRHAEVSAILRRAEEAQVDWDCFTAHCLQAADRLELPLTKLDIQDYAIKPIQRICRYPLMLGQLASLVNEQLPTEAAAARAVRAAHDAIKHAASRVDAAKQTFLCEKRSALIAARLELPEASQPAFLSVLGQNKLTGALFYIEPVQADQHVKVKYYGAFLYQSHLLLAKVKRQNCYEPRHWLPLRVFDVELVLEDECLLPHSFRLKHGQHVFELAATNAAERMLWYDSLSDVILARRQAWLSAVIENPVEQPFEDISISSIPIDTAALPETVASSSSSSSLQYESPPILSAPLPRRSLLGSTANTFLGRTPSATRAIIDLRLADVMSDECSTTRILAERDLSNGARAKFMSIRSRSDNRRTQSTSGTLSRTATFRDSFKRRSFVSDKPTAAEAAHRRRSSVDVVMHPPEPAEDEAGDEVGFTAALPLSRSRTGPVGQARSQSVDMKRWSVRNRTLSFHRASGSQDMAILGEAPATVGRADSSSSASSHGLVHSPGSSAPSSPLMTPRDLTPGFGGLFRSLSRRKSQNGLDNPMFSLGSPEQDALALQANDFLYGGSKGWRRPKWGSSGSLNSRGSSSSSLFGFFLPSAEAPVPEDHAVVSAEPSPLGEAPAVDAASSTYLVLPTDKRKRKLFRNLTRMTSLPSSNVDKQ